MCQLGGFLVKIQRSIIFIGLSILICFCVSSCKQQKSDTMVAGGVSAGSLDNVLMIVGVGIEDSTTWSCSSMVVSDSTLITFARCLYNKDIVFVKDHTNQLIGGTTIKMNPKYNFSEHKLTAGYAIGVVVFPDAPFREHTKVNIVNYAPKEGEGVRLVGFGGYTTKAEKNKSGYNVEVDSSKAKIRRTGYNKIVKRTYCNAGMLETHREGGSVTDKELSKSGNIDYSNAISSPGDYGGPLLKDTNDSLLGVITLQNADEKGVFKSDDVTYDCHVSPILRGNLEFLKDANQELKAGIPGLDDITPLDLKDFDI